VIGEARVIRSYRELVVWQRAIALVMDGYRATRSFPSEERFGLTSQLRRAAVSVAANIAEGHAREHRGDFLHHLSIARGSLAELETHVLIARALKFATPNDEARLLEQCDHVGRMLRRLRDNLPPAAPATRAARRATLTRSPAETLRSP
jgi:four helix bundle protein